MQDVAGEMKLNFTMNVIIDISQKRWLSEEEAVAYTTLGRDTLREARDMNQIPFRKKGRKIVYDRKHLDEWIERFDYHRNGRVITYKKYYNS